MNMVNIKPGFLNSKSFKPFGMVLGPGEIEPYYTEPGLDFWHGIDRIQAEKGEGQLSWLDIRGPRPFECNEMERHSNCTTTIIQMEGQSVIIFGLSKEDSPDKHLPDPDTLQAFIFDGTRGINLKPGTWFWNRYPLTPRASYIFILGKNFNTDIVDLKKELDITIRLILN